MSIIINLKQTRKNIEEALPIINKDAKLGEQIRFQHIHTLSKIIYIQSCRLAHYAALGMLREGNTITATDIACNKPKAYLAKCCQVTSKTIQNHIHRLEEKRLVKRVNEHGKLLLIVHPLLLSISPNFAHLQAVLWKNFENLNPQDSNNLDFSTGKTFPINNPSGNIKSIITSSVKMLKKESQSDEVIQETLQETQRAKPSPTKNGLPSLQINPSDQIRKHTPGARMANENVRFKQFIQRQALLLWIWCSENLYADRDFMSESQQEYAINYFTETLEQKQASKIYDEIAQLRTRLSKWKRFVSKETPIKRFTPLPSTFFNINHLKGFAQTEAWLKQDKQKEVYQKKWRIAKKIERRAVQILSGNITEKVKNPITQKIEVRYRQLTYEEKIKEFQKLEYRIFRLSEQFPNIGKWYNTRIKELAELCQMNNAA